MIRLLQRGSSLVKPPVSLKIFDLDDPNSDTIIDPNGIAGNDNNTTLIPKHGKLLGCTPTGVDSCSRVTDSSGTATAFFEVSKQPGDNFLVVASLDKTYLDTLILEGINIRDPATGEIIGTGPGIGGSDTRALGTSMLTVWRKLHIEVDSMGPVVGNQVPGTFDSVVLLGSNQADLTLIPDPPLAGNPPFDLSSNRFENGKIYIENTPYPVISSTAISNGKFNVKVDLSVGVAIVPGSFFSLVDDDDFNSNNGQALRGDESENLVVPDLSLLQSSYDPSKNVYAPAYVIPFRDLQNGEDSNVPFLLNSPRSEQVGGSLTQTYDFDYEFYHTDQNFWVIYLLGSYQSTVKLDNDPQSENAASGEADNQINGKGASIFFEVLRSQEAPIDSFKNAAATTAHESGHLFNGAHSDMGLMAQAKDRNSKQFTPKTLIKIRQSLNP